MVAAIVQVAAVHVGIPLLAARAMGQAAKDVFVSLARPDTDASKVRAVQCLDLTLSAKDGSLIDSPALREIAIDDAAGGINKLLDPDAPRSPPPTRPAPPATREPASPGRQASTRPAARPARPEPDPAPPPRSRPDDESGPSAPSPRQHPQPGGFGV
jgi:hypothetical protein